MTKSATFVRVYSPSVAIVVLSIAALSLPQVARAQLDAEWIDGIALAAFPVSLAAPLPEDPIPYPRRSPASPNDESRRAVRPKDSL